MVGSRVLERLREEFPSCAVAMWDDDQQFHIRCPSGNESTGYFATILSEYDLEVVVQETREKLGFDD